MEYMIVSVNEIWVVIAGGGIGIAVAGVRMDALVSASANANANAQNEKTNDGEITYPDLHNSSALRQMGCLREKRG
jgi:hypothetical protein